MIEAVIFDFGGVFTSSPFEAFAAFERARGLPENLIRRINSSNHENNAWALFERAEIDIDAFDRAFAAEALSHGHHVAGKDILPLLAGEFRPEMIEALRRIKTRFKTGCITNNMPHNAAGGSEAGRTLYAREIMELFDAVIESAKLGIRKPDPRIYRQMCDMLEVRAEDCVYLDDLGGNLKPARAMGMITIKVESGPQAIAELEAVTGLRLS
ncbi:MAG: HAD-IA family hydrolase [Alphaproteobacteria bacterium]|nr:HAD-IA family hydrolase [Alphaproteobacteria bacterium]MBV9693019.1 HAD-IA family hydrolase [Alphaproteobacteria bacterium]